MWERSDAGWEMRGQLFIDKVKARDDAVSSGLGRHANTGVGQHTLQLPVTVL